MKGCGVHAKRQITGSSRLLFSLHSARPVHGAGCSLSSQTSTPINPYVLQVTQASKVWGEVPLPEDLEADDHVKSSQALLDDDEDFAADEASGGGLAPQITAPAVLNSGQMVFIMHLLAQEKTHSKP